MEKLEGMIAESCTGVRALRALSNNVLNGNIKILFDAKGSPLQWFKTRLPELTEFDEHFQDDFAALEAARGRLEAMAPSEWTVLNMGELVSRMINEIKATDLLYTTLMEQRLKVIDLKRDALKGTLRVKHTKAMQHHKLAKPWIETGANKKMVLVLLNIGACWLFFVMPLVCSKTYRTVMLATCVKCVVLRCWTQVL